MLENTVSGQTTACCFILWYPEITTTKVLRKEKFELKLQPKSHPRLLPNFQRRVTASACSREPQGIAGGLETRNFGFLTEEVIAVKVFPFSHQRRGTGRNKCENPHSFQERPFLSIADNFSFTNFR